MKLIWLGHVLLMKILCIVMNTVAAGHFQTCAQA